MTREEEYNKAADNYFINFQLLDRKKKTVQEHFIKGIEWSDSHPRKGLVDIEKVCDWIQNNAFKYWEETAFYTSNLISDLCKAIED